MKKDAPREQPSLYKTEEQLKEEARLRAQQAAKLEQAKKPKSPGAKKAENYWYHYKWVTLGGAALLAFVAFFIGEMIFKTDPDVTVILVTKSYIDTQSLDLLAEELSAYVPDSNSDGKTVVNIDYIMMNPSSGLPGEDLGELEPDEAAMAALQGDQDYASTMKLVTVIAAGNDPVFLLDEENYQNLIAMSGGEDGAAEDVFFSLDFSGGNTALPGSATKLAEGELSSMMENLSFYLRQGSSNEKEKDATYRLSCLEFLQNLAA